MNDGPSVEQDIWQYYQENYPGQVQALGPDLWDGTPAQLQSFKDQTGATYPLLLEGTSGDGGNLSTLYGTYDNYVVINKQGIVRYHAADIWPHGNRYHLDEIRGTVDTLVTASSVDLEPLEHRLVLSSAPNPFGQHTSVRLTNPADSPSPAKVTVYDIGGNHVATLWDGNAAPGMTVLRWDGRAENGQSVSSGVYFILARIRGSEIATRVLYLR